METIKHYSAFATYTLHKNVVDINAPYTVFLHGGPGFNNDFERESMGPHFHKTHNFIWFDFLGCKNSPANNISEITLKNTILDMHEIFKKYTNGQVNLIGFCVSTLIINHYVKSYPEMIKKVVFFSPVIKVAAFLQDVLKVHYKKGTLKLDPKSKTTYDSLVRPNLLKFTPQELEQFGNLTLQIDNLLDVYWENKIIMQQYLNFHMGELLALDVYFAIQIDLFNNQILDLTSMYTNIDVLIIKGEKDQITNWEQNGLELTKQIPHAQVETLANSGHWAYLENQKISTQLIKNFLN
ncbi:MAG: alpha/beta fold hydrolase [Bacteriovoracaceae bacterium]|nr:alpha/beta fold hydrolase [Bacteriovoracaceae bacterium]